MLSVAVLEAVHTGERNVHCKILVERQKKKEKYNDLRNYYVMLYLNDALGIEFTVCYGELIPQRALTSFNVCNAYRHFAGNA